MTLAFAVWSVLSVHEQAIAVVAPTHHQHHRIHRADTAHQHQPLNGLRMRLNVPITKGRMTYRPGIGQLRIRQHANAPTELLGPVRLSQVGLSDAEAATQTTLKNAETRAKAVLNHWFGHPDIELRLIKSAMLPNGVIAVQLQQQYQGIDLDSAVSTFTFGHHHLLQASFSLIAPHHLPSSQQAFDTSNLASANASQTTAISRAIQSAVDAQPELSTDPQLRNDPILQWTRDIQGTWLQAWVIETTGGGHDWVRRWISADTQSRILHEENLTAHAVEGTVSMPISICQSNGSLATETSLMPGIQWTDGQYADAKGAFSSAQDVAQASVGLETSTYRIVNAAQGSGNSGPFTFPLVSGAANDLVVSTSQVNLAESTAIRFLGMTTSATLSHLDPNDPLATALLNNQYPATVNVSSTCNANFDGTGLNFFSEGGGCYNTAELNGVVHHEAGHQFDFLSADGAVARGGGVGPSEGFADVQAILTENSVLMPNHLFQSTGCHVSLRDPLIFKDYCRDGSCAVGLSVPSIHSYAQVHTGAFWEIMEALKDTYGEDEGLAKAWDLHLALLAAPGVNMDNLYQTAIAADTDPATGIAPHTCIINDAYANEDQPRLPDALASGLVEGKPFATSKHRMQNETTATPGEVVIASDDAGATLTVDIHTDPGCAALTGGEVEFDTVLTLFVYTEEDGQLQFEMTKDSETASPDGEGTDYVFSTSVSELQTGEVFDYYFVATVKDGTGAEIINSTIPSQNPRAPAGQVLDRFMGFVPHPEQVEIYTNDFEDGQLNGAASSENFAVQIPLTLAGAPTELLAGQNLVLKTNSGNDKYAAGETVSFTVGPLDTSEYSNVVLSFVGNLQCADPCKIVVSGSETNGERTVFEKTWGVSRSAGVPGAWSTGAYLQNPSVLTTYAVDLSDLASAQTDVMISLQVEADENNIVASGILVDQMKVVAWGDAADKDGAETVLLNPRDCQGCTGGAFELPLWLAIAGWSVLRKRRR